METHCNLCQDLRCKQIKVLDKDKTKEVRTVVHHHAPIPHRVHLHHHLLQFSPWQPMHEVQGEYAGKFEKELLSTHEPTVHSWHQQKTKLRYLSYQHDQYDRFDGYSCPFPEAYQS